MGIKKLAIILSVTALIILGVLYFRQETSSAEDKVRELPEVRNILSSGNWNIRTEDRGDGYKHVQVYEVVDEHTNTFNWYKVNKQGDIICSMFTYDKEGNLEKDIEAMDCN